MLTVRDEIANLIGEMKVKAREAQSPDAERETVEIAAIALAQAVPDVTPDMPLSLITAYARAALHRAWVQHDMNKRIKALTPKPESIAA